MTHQTVTNENTPVAVRGIVYRHGWWARLLKRPGRFERVYSDAKGLLTWKDSWWFSRFKANEIDLGGKRWFLDCEVGEVVVADMECGMSTSRTLQDGEALLMEVGCLRVVSVDKMGYERVVASFPANPYMQS